MSEPSAKLLRAMAEDAVYTINYAFDEPMLAIPKWWLLELADEIEQLKEKLGCPEST
jgi:hypothetical protein